MAGLAEHWQQNQGHGVSTVDGACWVERQMGKTQSTLKKSKETKSHDSPQIFLWSYLPTSAPSQSPAAQILNPETEELVPTQVIMAETKAPRSCRGRRTQTSRPETFKMSIGMAMPVSPRNCFSADVRYCRTVSSSSDMVPLVFAVIVSRCT